MKEILLGDKSGRFYQSRLNDRAARDQKAREVKAKGFKNVHCGQYECQGGDNLFFNSKIVGK